MPNRQGESSPAAAGAITATRRLLAELEAALDEVEQRLTDRDGTPLGPVVALAVVDCYLEDAKRRVQDIASGRFREAQAD